MRASLLMLTLLSILDPHAIRAEASLGEHIVPGHVLVELKPGAAPSGAVAMLAASVTGSELGGVVVEFVRPLVTTQHDGGPPLVLLRTSATDEATTRRDITLIAADPWVRRAEPDRLRRAAFVPNDPMFAQQQNLAQVKVPQSWDWLQQSGLPRQKVVVAVLDTGIVKGHPDLDATRFLPGYDFITDPDNAADGDGGRDPDPNDSGTADQTSSGLHGLHVVGIIGAIINNGAGVAGITDAWCLVMPVRVLGVQQGSGADSDITDAILWTSGEDVGGVPRLAAAVDVINMSFGGLGTSFTLQRAIDVAIADGVIVVAAADNDHLDGQGARDAATVSPGGLDRVITIGASRADLSQATQGKNSSRADFSNYGPRVDLLAPGDGVLSTYRDLGQVEGQGPFTYYPLVGTSQAAPHVSAAAALVRSIVRVRQRTMEMMLRASANATYRCDFDPQGGCGAGLLDVTALLTLASTQIACFCPGDQFCQDGQCVDVGFPHPSLHSDTTVGGCSAAGGAVSADPSRLFLLLCVGLALRAARPRTGPRAGCSRPDAAGPVDQASGWHPFVESTPAVVAAVVEPPSRSSPSGSPSCSRKPRATLWARCHPGTGAEALPRPVRGLPPMAELQRRL